MDAIPTWTWVLAGVLICAALLWLVRWRSLPPSDRRLLTLRRPLARLVRTRLGGYRQTYGQVDESLPAMVSERRRVAVVGGGLGGISAAAHLVERGFDVTLLEKETYLGGKIGAWDAHASDGGTLKIEHGFHAFFRHYYNLNDFLRRVGAAKSMKSIEDYWIIERDGQVWRFAEVEPTPVLNLVDLWRRGLYSMGQLMRTPAIREMDIFLKYDAERTFRELDGTSLRTFADRTRLPEKLRMVFTTFSRAFFAEEDRLSLAQLVKSFHYYYLSHDHGLVYDYPAADYQDAVLAPIQRHLEDHGVTLRLGRQVDRIGYDGEHFEVGGASYDYAVVATHAVAARGIAEASPDLQRRAPLLCRQLSSLEPSQRYAVWRIWIDRDIRSDIPVFVSTDRELLLDAVAVYHRITDEARSWVGKNGGAVLELHSYAVPDHLGSDDEIRDHFARELVQFFPELAGFSILEQVLQVRGDFTAFHVDMAADRPESLTELPGLVLAGDWVRLRIPAMLMEAAFSAGLIAANTILRREGVRTHAVYTVPPKGILSWRPRSGRQKHRARRTEETP